MGKLNGGISGTTLNRERWRLWLSLLLFAWLAVGASPPARAGLTASPGACYVDGSGLCTTQIVWQSNMNTTAEIFVSMDGRPGVPFACNAGSFQATAPWIQAGHYYAFVAYPTHDCAAMSTDGLGAPFAGVAVMGYSVTGQLSASPNPCSVGSNGLCTAMITWQSAQNAGVEIFVSMDGGPAKLFACNAGSFQSVAPWIQAGHSYAFVAFRSNTCTAASPAGLGAPLSGVVVTGYNIRQRGLIVGNDVPTPGTPLEKASIFTVHADNTGKKMLTGPGNQYPSWTPDGRIIFVSNRSGSPQIWIMDANGANARQIGNIQMSRITRVQMARNGLIAFMQTGDGIWLMQPDGSGLRELFKFKNGAGDAPSLALSGTWLTFTYPAESTPGHNEIFRINTDGTGLRQLTFPTDPDYPDANASAISPDETMVAIYTGVESHPGDTVLTWGHRNIAIISPDGGPRRLITHCQPVTTLQELQNFTAEQCLTSDNPSWSPDGRWVIYDRGSSNPAGAGTWTVDVNGNNLQRLIPDFTGGGSVPLRFAY